MKILFIALIVLLTSMKSKQTEIHKQIVVLELFTSPGCSSCPPVEIMLNKIHKTSAPSIVIAMSYDVHYWNYIGLKDPFSKTEFS